MAQEKNSIWILFFVLFILWILSKSKTVQAALRCGVTQSCAPVSYRNNPPVSVVLKQSPIRQSGQLPSVNIAGTTLSPVSAIQPVVKTITGGITAGAAAIAAIFPAFVTTGLIKVFTAPWPPDAMDNKYGMQYSWCDPRRTAGQAQFIADYNAWAAKVGAQPIGCNKVSPNELLLEPVIARRRCRYGCGSYGFPCC